MKRLLFSLTAATMLFAACNHIEKVAEANAPPAFDLKAAKASIDSTNAAFSKAISASDSNAVAAMYTSDAIIMAPNMAPIKGKAGIVAFAGEAIRMGNPVFKLEATEVTGNDDGVQEVGVYTISDQKGNALDKGKYIVLWKKEGGSWKLHRDIFNSNMPMMPMEAPKKK